MCGIAGYASSKPTSLATSIVLSILIELQHRGQESAGLATVSPDGYIEVRSGRGTVIEALLNGLTVDMSHRDVFGAIAHTRYSTSGGYMDSVPQPIVIGNGDYRFALAVNGTIANYKMLAKTFGIEGNYNDAQVLANVLYRLALEHNRDVIEALKSFSEIAVGGYSVVILTSEPRLVIARDPYGFRPLAYSYNDEEIAVASETAALDVVGYNNWAEVGAGEIISFDGKSLERTHSITATFSPCAFEYVYISRLDSVFNNVNIYTARVQMGYELSKMMPVEADIVVPVPDSGRGAAIGYSRGSGIPLEEGLVINRYLGRGFILPPGLRDVVAKLKYGFIKTAIQGKKVILVDDSIVRGTTMAAIASRLRKYGAKEVHIRISSPPFRYPCFMGIDIASRSELLAWRKMDLVDIASYLNADTVAYNTVENIVKSIGINTLCLACFTGAYPFKGLGVEDLEEMFSR
ncbi:MAG: amidophosphoribosyltransferase [Ignisphaera sp.]